MHRNLRQDFGNLSEKKFSGIGRIMLDYRWIYPSGSGTIPPWISLMEVCSFTINLGNNGPYAPLLSVRTTYNVDPHKIGDNNSSSKIEFEDLRRLQIRNSNFESMSFIFSNAYKPCHFFFFIFAKFILLLECISTLSLSKLRCILVTPNLIL